LYWQACVLGEGSASREPKCQVRDTYFTRDKQLQLTRARFILGRAREDNVMAGGIESVVE
jgi:hypothetical protein